MDAALEKAIREYEFMRGYGDSNPRDHNPSKKYYESIDKKLFEHKKNEGFNSQFLLDFMSYKVNEYGVKSNLLDLLIEHSSAEDWTIDLIIQLDLILKKCQFINIEGFFQTILIKLLKSKIVLSSLVLHYFYNSPWIHKGLKYKIEQLDNFKMLSSMILSEIEKYSDS